MTKLRGLLFFFLSFIISGTVVAQTFSMRAPAYPLITHNPYFSVWSFTDQLNGDNTRHWTGKSQPMIGLIRVDGKVYRFMGSTEQVFKPLLSTAEENSYNARYTETQPENNEWKTIEYDDGGWKTGKAPFSDQATGGTPWKSHDLWFRRTFTLKSLPKHPLYLDIIHDDNAEVYVNGVLVYQYTGWLNKMKKIPLPAEAIRQLRTGKNILSVHVANTAGGAMLDAGLSEEIPVKSAAQNAIQNYVKINATQTIYNFTCGGVDLDLVFTSPLIIKNVDLMARPVSYISFKVKANDGKQHPVEVLNGISSNLAVNTPAQQVVATKYAAGNLQVMKVGSKDQPVLQKKGDDLRIDWGYLYVASRSAAQLVQFVGSLPTIETSFLQKNYQNTANDHSLLLNTVYNLGVVGSKEKEAKIMVGYDAVYAIQYFGKDLRPWWNRTGDKNFDDILTVADKEYNTVLEKCAQENKQIYDDALKAGDEEYARLCVLAYRQSIAAHELVQSPDGNILFLSKENFSNGSINTVDVTYPSAPLFLLYNSALMKGMLNGIFYYSESGKWKKPFPSHDLGTFPLANGQTYGEDMPVEEAGNLLILTAAIAHSDGDASYAQKHWEVLSTWAAYLLKEGFDPANQLCTDDFAGHLARNANLSIKAIVALAAYADLAGKLGKADVATQYRDSVSSMAKRWELTARDGDHYSLAFGAPDTWSQKYNMVWDKILGYNFFDPAIYRKEVAFYLTKLNTYGLPLDSRKSYTKSDWTIWSATLASDKQDFDHIISPLYKAFVETPTRVPMTDWYETMDASQIGFQARSVVGGYFIKVLADHYLKEK